MTHGQSDQEIIQKTHNVARYFTETRQIAWVLLIATLFWGLYAYYHMPQRKDPDIPVRQAVALIPWPGAGAEKVETIITRRAEEKIAENASVERIESTSQNGGSLIYITLSEKARDTGKEFDDIKLKLDSLQELPQGAGPVQFIKDFGDTAALMLTVASPLADVSEIAIRAQSIQQAIEQVRRSVQTSQGRAAIIVCFPQTLSLEPFLRKQDLFARYLSASGRMTDLRRIHGAGFIGIDGKTGETDSGLLHLINRFISEQLRLSEFHPDVWSPVVIRSPQETEGKLTAVRGEKYSYADLDRFSNLIRRTLQTVPQVSKVSIVGLVKERVYLDYSQERLAAYGIKISNLDDILQARNSTLPGGNLETDSRNLSIDPSGELKTERDLGRVVVAVSDSGLPVHLQDLGEITRDYEQPPGYLNFYTWKDSTGRWQRTRAVTLAIQMRPGEQIDKFGSAIDKGLEGLYLHIPKDLILARTSDQPLQVKESVNLFMRSLYEAIFLVVLVALIGFREWRSALLMAFSIPLTLAMTFGMMQILGIDLQQVSIASLIIALGLLVDDPVVAGDAIKRELAADQPPEIAAWLGPTKLATAILFATITNIVAYLPLLTLSGDTRLFLYSLPVVLACSLIASRLVSMTFIPLLGYYLLRLGSKKDPTLEERRSQGFAGFYYKIGMWSLEHRWKVMGLSLILLALGAFFLTNLKTQFFPKDLSYLAYVDVWLPENASLAATDEVSRKVEEIIQTVAAEFGKTHPEKGGPKAVLHSITSFLGGGGPRFWFSVSPEQEQPNYAQVLFQMKDSHDTQKIVAPLQKKLSEVVPGARLDVRQLETGSVVGIPVQVRLTGQEIGTLRELGENLKALFRSIPQADRVRDDWGAEGFNVRLKVDSDRANLAGVSNADVAASTAAAISGFQVTTIRQGDQQIPVMARLRMEERARLSDIRNLYVHSQQGPQKVPLSQISRLDYDLETGKIRRRNQFRTLTVSCFPVSGVLASEVLEAARSKLTDFEKKLPPGYGMKVGGEEEEQNKGFMDLSIVMIISIVCIFLALVFQFKSIIKPFIVFAAIPYGIVGSLGALWVMNTSFDFMAFLGIASLIGVIVSHIIVLFDFVEEMQAQGKPFREAVLDAGIARLRPVFITVGATVLGLVPLALHGGPLWEPLCYTQIGGLLVANFITKLLVPAVYAICVLDLKILTWEEKEKSQA